MKPTIIFIASTITDSHCKNRIEQFIQQGYQVIVYSFRRDNEKTPTDLPYDVNIIGEIVSANYLKRLQNYFKGIRALTSKHNNDQHILYYVFGLDLALFLRLFVKSKKYIYEEADLVQTYLPNKIITSIFNHIDRQTILHSLYTILTSEGYLKYHFRSGNYPQNILIIPNKLNPAILKYPVLVKPTNIDHLRLAFVGGARFDSIDCFVEVFLSHFPQHEFHFYGPVEPRMNRFAEQYQNVFYHGRFKNPEDLANIYKNIDVLLCTYDYRFDNVRYAEPNKLYEAIYFRKPIIVSTNTFLSEKVSSLNIGYSIDPFDTSSIVSFIQNLSLQSIQEKQDACSKIAQEDCLMNDELLFKQLVNY